jgi:hypothetical protein
VSQLTSVGLLQHSMLGLFLGRRYSSEFLSSNWTLAATFYSRTILSLLAFDANFLPTACHAPIRQFDSPFLCSDCPPCPARDFFLDFAPNKNFWGVEKSALKLRKFFKKNLGDQHLESIIDYVTSRYCFTSQLPFYCSSKAASESCLSRSAYAQLFELSDAAVRRRYSDVNFQRYAFLAAYDVLHRVANATTSRAIYAAHDVTLEALLAALGAETPTRIPYASRIVFEFWREPSQLEPTLRILFNGNPVFPTDTDGIHVPQFRKILQERFRFLFPGAASTADACRLEFAETLLRSTFASTFVSQNIKH